MRHFYISFILAILVFNSLSLFAQKKLYYFDLSDLLTLTIDKDDVVKSKVVPKGYDWWETLSTDTTDFYSEPITGFRTGSNLIKCKRPVDKVFKLLYYSVALQYSDQVSWLRLLNKTLKDSGFNKISLNETTDLHLNKDSSIQVFIQVKKNKENIQVATASIYRLLNQVNVIRQFSVQELEFLYQEVEIDKRNEYMSSNSFLAILNKDNAYFQKSSDGEILVIIFSKLRYFSNGLQLAFSSYETYKKYLDLLILGGYKKGVKDNEFKKGKFTLSVDRKELTITLVEL